MQPCSHAAIQPYSHIAILCGHSSGLASRHSSSVRVLSPGLTSSRSHAGQSRTDSRRVKPHAPRHAMWRGTRGASEMWLQPIDALDWPAHATTPPLGRSPFVPSRDQRSLMETVNPARHARPLHWLAVKHHVSETGFTKTKQADCIELNHQNRAWEESKPEGRRNVGMRSASPHPLSGLARLPTLPTCVFHL
jgi:hypothetical protein